MQRKKISFIVASPLAAPLASTRISVMNMLPYLQNAGWEIDVVYEPPAPVEEPDLSGLANIILGNGSSVAYFQKVHGPSVLTEAGAVAEKGIKTVYGVCDYVDNAMAAAFHRTIVMTDFLKSLYDRNLWKKIYVVHDGIERPDLIKDHYEQTTSRLRVVTVNSKTLSRLPVIGTPPGYIDACVVGNYAYMAKGVSHAKELWWTLGSSAVLGDKIAAAHWYFRRRFRKVHWRLESVYSELLSADVGIIPVEPEGAPVPGLRVPWWMVSSENRLTLMMAIGLPVIASPVPAYLPVIENGRNGFIAKDKREWKKCLQELRDTRLRETIGQAARASVILEYSKERQAEKLIRALESME